jgi:hypothetical protein
MIMGLKIRLAKATTKLTPQIYLNPYRTFQAGEMVAIGVCYGPSQGRNPSQKGALKDHPAHETRSCWTASDIDMAIVCRADEVETVIVSADEDPALLKALAAAPFKVEIQAAD